MIKNQIDSHLNLFTEITVSLYVQLMEFFEINAEITLPDRNVHFWNKRTTHEQQPEVWHHLDKW